MIEVGPGPGGLTRALLLEGAAQVTAIERDARCVARAAEIARPLARPADVDRGRRAEGRLGGARRGPPRRMVANLPYNVGTPLLVGWLSAEPWPPYWAA